MDIIRPKAVKDLRQAGLDKNELFYALADLWSKPCYGIKEVKCEGETKTKLGICLFESLLAENSRIFSACVLVLSSSGQYLCICLLLWKGRD
jgi:hypothetical protein